MKWQSSKHLLFCAYEWCTAGPSCIFRAVVQDVCWSYLLFRVQMSHLLTPTGEKAIAKRAAFLKGKRTHSHDFVPGMMKVDCCSLWRVKHPAGKIRELQIVLKHRQRFYGMRQKWSNRRKCSSWDRNHLS